MLNVAQELSDSLRRMTRDEYQALADTGAFDAERVELLGGFVVAERPQNRRHAVAVQRFVEWFNDHRQPGQAVRPRLHLSWGARRARA